jgi:hypothetical protein
MSMNVHDLECPNCGATVEFGGGTRATCAYCQSALLLTGGSVQTEPAPADRHPETATPASVPLASARPLFKAPRPMSDTGFLRVGCAFVIVALILFVCACGAFVTLGNSVLLRVWGPLDQVATTVQQQPEVARALGQPIRLGSPSSSSFQSKNGNTTVKFDVPVIGASATGKAHVEGRWLEDGWNLKIWITYPSDEGEQQILIQRQGVR